MFEGQWESELPGGLAAARRSGLCVNALSTGILGDDLSMDMVSPSDQSLIRFVLLTVFISCGVPCLSAAALSSADLIRFVGILAVIRKNYRGLLSPPRPTHASREVLWHSVISGKYCVYIISLYICYAVHAYTD